MLGELGFAKPRQAPVEVGYREALPTQRRPGSSDHLKDMTQTSLAEPPHYSVPFRKQGEVPNVVPALTQSTDDLVKVDRLYDGHGRDDRSGVLGQREIEDFVYALPPRAEILKVTAQCRRQSPMQAEPDLLRIADDAAAQTPLQFVRGLRLSAAKRSVDPDQHAQTLLRVLGQRLGCRSCAQPDAIVNAILKTAGGSR